jgi:hypothetical protein
VREQIFSTLKKPRCKGLIQIATNRFFLMTTEDAEENRCRGTACGVPTVLGVYVVKNTASVSKPLNFVSFVRFVVNKTLE